MNSWLFADRNNYNFPQPAVYHGIYAFSTCVATFAD